MKLFASISINLLQCRRAFLIVLLAICAVFIPSISTAQSANSPANCEEIKDPDLQFQADLCKAHAGCNLVYAIHNTCVKAKKFLTNLKEAIGEGTKSFFGFKKEITPEAVWQANLSDTAKKLEGKPEWRERVGIIEATIKEKGQLTIWSEGGKNFTLGDTKFKSTESTSVYYTDNPRTVNGVTTPNGRGYNFASDGSMIRGVFDGFIPVQGDYFSAHGGRAISNRIQGNSDYKQVIDATADGWQYIGTQKIYSNTRDGEGVRTAPDGRRWEGLFVENKLTQGAFYRATGTLAFKGIWGSDEKLQVGQAYDNVGNVTEINKIADQARLVAEKKQKEDVEKQAKLTSETQAFRSSLGSMTVGQLFAKADELSTTGDSTKAREVLRALVTRFPDHPLAATAAQRLSAMQNTNSNVNNASGSAGNTATSNVRRGDCETLLAQQNKEFETVNRRPTPAGATPPLMRVMWMTLESIKVIDANCPNESKWAKYRSELKTAHDQAKTACGQMMAG